MNEAPRQRGGATPACGTACRRGAHRSARGAITISGHWPELKQMVHFAGKGLAASDPSDITRSRCAPGRRASGFRRATGGWTIDGMTDAVPAELLRTSTSACGCCMSASRRARSRPPS